MRVFEMFAGYGGASFALTMAGMDHEVVGFSEIDKDAISIYYRNHGEIRNYGDCTCIDEKCLPKFDLLTGGFPCQPFSRAGKRGGVNDLKGTLFYDIVRIAAHNKPKYMVLENVEGILTLRHGRDFHIIIQSIRKIGYGVIYRLMNSLDYGTPQNRERVWIICKYGGWDFDEYKWPNKVKSPTWKTFIDDPKNFVKVKKTVSRDAMRTKCVNITNKDFVYTISTKQDRYPNAGIIDFDDYYRFLTPRECFRMMGFFNDEINIDGYKRQALYKLAGNGWDVNVARKIFFSLYKGGMNNAYKEIRHT